MKRTGIILMLIAFTLSIMGCLFAQGVEKQIRDVAPFNGVKVGSGITLYLTQGEENKVTVEADGSIINDLVTKTEDGVLRIYIKTKRLLRLKSSPEVYVTYSWLNSIEASAGAEVNGQNTVISDKLVVETSSGATATLEVECRDLEMYASSGSTIKLTGATLNLIAKASSGSTIKSRDLKSVNARLEASSGSDIQVHVSGELEASASSGAGIQYYGEAIPKLLRQSSGGDIKKR